MTATTQPRRTMTIRETMADGMTVELSVALDACGVPVEDLALPEAMYDELNRGWSAFATAALEAEVVKQLTKPIEPFTPMTFTTHTSMSGRSVTSRFFRMDKSEIWSPFQFLVAAWSLVSLGFASLYAAIGSVLILSGELFLREEPFFVSLLALVSSPLFWCSSLDAAQAKTHHWFRCTGWIAVLLAVAFPVECWHVIVRLNLGAEMRLEMPLMVGALAALFGSTTPLPWGLARAVTSLLPTRRRAWQRYEEAFRAYEARREELLAQQRPSPALLRAFLDAPDGAKRVFEDANVQWTRRSKELVDAIGAGRALKMREEAAGGDPTVVAELGRALARMQAQAQAIRDDESRVALARASLKVFSEELEGRTKRLAQQEEALAWLREQNAQYDAAEVALSRTRAEIDAALRWFYRQFRLQMAQLDAGEEVAALPAPRHEIDDLLARRRADLEVVEALTKA